MPRRRRTPPDTAQPTSGDGTCSVTTCPTSAAPFFTLAIEGPNTVVALDSSENEIVSLHFDDFNDLTSHSFREYATAAVTAVVGSGGGNGIGTAQNVSRGIQQAENEVISLLDSESNRNNDEIYIEDDIDEIFAEILAENESAALAAVHAVENLDADLALALKLQEEEEEEQQKAIGTAGGEGGAWGSTRHQQQQQDQQLAQEQRHFPKSSPPPPRTCLPTTTDVSSSYSNIMGTAPGVSTALSIHLSQSRNSHKVSDTEFPLLSPKLSLTAQYSAGDDLLSSSSLHQRRGVPLKTTMAAERSAGIRKVNISQRSRTTGNNRSQEEGVVVAAVADGDPHGVHGQSRQHSFNQLSTTQFLDSHDGEAVEARATALRYLERQQTENSTNNNDKTTAATASASREAIKRMMDGSNITSSFNTEKRDSDDNPYSGGGYSRRKIRTLVMSMIAAGWEFMPDRRGSGHYIYQRFIPPTNQKQILVLPCTPSSQRSIEAVHSRLQRMDREAAAVRAAALGREGGG